MELLSDLVALGLTEYEGKIYLALLKESPANGYQLSKRTGVPRSMVYEALGRLHSRGAILKSGDERTTIYRPLPPEELLERYDRQHRQLISNLHDKLTTIYASQEEEALWSISGPEAIYSYASQMIQRGETEIYLVMGDDALERLRKDILAICDTGVRVGALLTGGGELECDQVSHHPPAESEIQGLENMLIVVVDGEECLIANMELDMSATVTTNKKLVLISRQFVWMELFAQRVYERLSPAMLDLLEDVDKQLLLSFSYQA
ncbi:MAG TPA: helix-turn-helix domain-containing protein [Anaerolineales bacterium]|nr:helix-turn-helix domain-containing protein [Anaerolineales bacterium]